MQKNIGLLAVGGVVVLIAGAVAAAPFWFGMQTEEAYRKMIQEAGKDGQIVISLQSYERGWLDSTAQGTIAIPGAPVTISYTDRIYHGPIPIEDEIDFQPVLAVIRSQATLNLPVPIKLPALTARTMVYIEGNFKSRVEIAAFNSGGPTDSKIVWQGLSGEISGSADLKQTKMDLTSPLFQVTAPNQKFSISGMTISADLQKGASGLSTGSLNYAIGKISNESDKGKFSMNGLRLTSQSSEAGGNLTANLGMQLRDIGDGVSTYGPAQLNIKVSNIDVASLVKYEKDMRAIQIQKLPPDQVMSTLTGKLLELVSGLAKKSPVVDVTKMSFKINNGEITGKARFVLDGSKSDIASNPGLLFQAFSGESEIIVPQPALEALIANTLAREVETYKTQGRFTEAEMKKLTPQKVSEISMKAAPKFIDRYAASMRLVPDGENYKISMIIGQGQFLLNGQPLNQPIPLP